MCCRELATWAELLQLKAIWIVTTILLGDVVTLFAINAGHSDLWADVRGLACHVLTPSNYSSEHLPEPNQELKITSPSYLLKIVENLSVFHAQIFRSY